MTRRAYWLEVFTRTLDKTGDAVIARQTANDAVQLLYPPRPAQPRAENGRFAPVMSEGQRYTVSTMQYDPAAGER